MEPRPSERGNSSRPGGGRRFVSMLQWSHVLPNVETVLLLVRDNNGLARLQWSHVLPNVETQRCRPRVCPAYCASMEPRPSERGNVNRKKMLMLMGDAS